MGNEVCSITPKPKEGMLMLQWYDDSPPAKASSSGYVTPKSIIKGLYIQPCYATMVESTDQLSGFDLSEKHSNELPAIESQFGSITKLFASQEKTMSDVIGEVMKKLNFDVMELVEHLEVGNVNALYFAGSGQEGLSLDETFVKDDLDPPINLNRPVKFIDGEGFVSGCLHNEQQPVQDSVHEDLERQQLVAVQDKVDERVDSQLEVVQD